MTEAAETSTEISFEAALAAALGQTEAPSEPSGNQPAADAQASQPAEAQQVAPEAGTKAAPGAEVQPPPPSAKELERIAALEAREAKLRAAEDRAKELDAREARLKAREASQWESFERDPVAHIRAMRPELSAAEAARVAESLYFHAMGDKAPPQYRAKQEVAQTETRVMSEVEKLRAELESERAARARTEQESQVAAYRTELRAGAVIDEAPIVANLVKRNPERATEMLFEVARRAAIEAKQAGAAEPVVLTPAQAAAKLEALLKAERDELYGSPDPTVPPVQNAKQSSPSPTISNRDASVQPTRVAPDLLDDKTLRKAALEAAGLGHLEAWD